MIQRPCFRRHSPSRKQMAGFGIVELMVSLALGLFIIGGAISVFVTNQRVSRTNEQLSRMQESGRTAVELMARQLREAGGSPCGRGVLTSNTINNPSSHWWANWSDGIRGYDGTVASSGVAFGTGTGQRVRGTDAVFVVYGNPNNGLLIASHEPPSAQFKLNTTAHGFTDGDIVMVCNYRQGAVFQLTNASATNDTVVHNSGTGTPGNCSKGLGYPTNCSNPLGNQYQFSDGHMVRLSAEIWYIGTNSRGRRSLYRARMLNNGGIPSTVAEEIAENVTDLQLTFLEPDATGVLPVNYVAPTAVTSWPKVTAARVTVTLQSQQQVGTDNAVLQRQMSYVATLRNRLP